ncbi:MAG: hypothetical protein V8S98_08835 [Lachnospiraceae bacterium]
MMKPKRLHLPGFQRKSGNAGQKHHLRVFRKGVDGGRQGDTADLRHDHIGEDQIDRMFFHVLHGGYGIIEALADGHARDLI